MAMLSVGCRPVNVKMIITTRSTAFHEVPQFISTMIIEAGSRSLDLLETKQ